MQELVADPEMINWWQIEENQRAATTQPLMKTGCLLPSVYTSSGYVTVGEDASTPSRHSTNDMSLESDAELTPVIATSSFIRSSIAITDDPTRLQTETSGMPPVTSTISVVIRKELSRASEAERSRADQSDTGKAGGRPERSDQSFTTEESDGRRRKGSSTAEEAERRRT